MNAHAYPVLRLHITVMVTLMIEIVAVIRFCSVSVSDDVSERYQTKVV